MNISDGKKKDLILEYIINVYETKNILPSSDEIQNDLLPDCSIEELDFLLCKIEMHNPKIIDIYIGSTSTCVTKIYYVKPFLERGGFQKIEQNEKKKNQKEIFDLKISKFKYYTFWPLFIIALIGSGLSIYNYTQSVNEDENVIPDKPETKKLNVITKKSDTLNVIKIINPIKK